MTDIIATVAAAVSAAVAILAIWYSREATQKADAQVRVAHDQVQAAREQVSVALSANSFAQQLGQSEAVIQFTGRYGELVSSGMRFGDRPWEYQVWALLALEYYFFERRWIPDFIFELWIVELASLYEREEVRASHLRYMNDYSDHYDRMRHFFGRLQSIAETGSGSRELRNRRVSQLVGEWPRDSSINV